MDKKDWEESLRNLENLLKLKQESEAVRLKKDIEELKFTIECYRKKIETFK